MEGEANYTQQPRKKPKASSSSNPPPSSSSSSHHHHDLTLFPLLLAALATIYRRHSRSLIKRLLQSNLALIQAKPTTPLPNGLLALLPDLLLLPDGEKNSSLRVLAAETVSAIALSSLEANTEVGSDGAVVDALVEVVGEWRRKKTKVVIVAACDAVLDLLTGPVARERLSESRALVEMLSLFCQVTTPALHSLSGSATKGRKDCSKIEFMKDKLSMLALDAVLALVITSKEKILADIPKELSNTSLIILKKLWHMSQCGKSSIQSQEEEHICSRKYDLAETIFRLSMNEVQYSCCSVDTVRRGIFGSREFDLVHFLSNYWENSPFLFGGSSENVEDQNAIFSSLRHSFHGETMDTVLNSVLHGLVSCPPIVLDELDIISFLNEVKGVLGSPLVYGQDIRVIRTQKTQSWAAEGYPGKEVHFFEDSMCSANTNDSKTIFVDDVQKCKQAFYEGFTIAIRGMAFRSKEIAKIADGLAILFGQPSVGANVYLTPPGSQGLSCHYDDHCVFVCQIIGQKQWILFHHPASILPRLFDPLGDLSSLGGLSEVEHFTLHEGNILYIPRGYPHEAHTVFCADESISGANGVSLHLTFAIEIEPPFEWEGFTHIALHCWNEKKTDTHFHVNHCELQIPNAMFVNLLHIAIRMIGTHEPIFRKACMVGAFPSSIHSKMEHHLPGQKAVFHHIIDKIDTNCSFLEAFKSAKEIVSESNGEPLQCLRWLRQLPRNIQDTEKDISYEMFEDFEHFIRLSDGNIDDFAAAFNEVKSKFCRQVVFEDACKSFEVLLEEYRTTRRQYMNGMLSLHSNL